MKESLGPRGGAAVGVVVASEGYPDAPPTGRSITGAEPASAPGALLRGQRGAESSPPRTCESWALDDYLSRAVADGRTPDFTYQGLGRNTDCGQPFELSTASWHAYWVSYVYFLDDSGNSSLFAGGDYWVLGRVVMPDDVWPHLSTGIREVRRTWQIDDANEQFGWRG